MSYEPLGESGVVKACSACTDVVKAVNACNLWFIVNMHSSARANFEKGLGKACDHATECGLVTFGLLISTYAKATLSRPFAASDAAVSLSAAVCCMKSGSKKSLAGSGRDMVLTDGVVFTSNYTSMLTDAHIRTWGRCSPSL
jgi:hypothetical protein